MGFTRVASNRALARSIALPVGVALVIGVGASGAHAAPDDPVPAPAATVGAATPAFGLPPLMLPPALPAAPAQDARLAAALARLDVLPPQAGPVEIAAALFPDDEALRTETVLRLGQVEAVLTAAQEDGASALPEEEMRPQAVPAVVLAALPFITRCTIGALGGAGVDTAKSLVLNGQWATAESMIFEAVLGCVSAVVWMPSVKRRIAQEVAGLVLWIIVHTT